MTIKHLTAEQAEKIIAEHEQKVKERAEQAEKTAKCPVCGARREREQRMSRFEQDILSYLRSNRIIKMDSCILCVQKHIARAMIYYEEMMTASGSGKDDATAKIDIKKNHLKVLGHLGCAIEESDEYTDLNKALIEQERQYRYEGIEPDWEYLSALIVEYEQVIAAAGAIKNKL